MLNSIEHRFAHAIRTPGAPPPPDVIAVTAEVPRRRFDVYRDNAKPMLALGKMSQVRLGLRTMKEQNS